MKAYHWPGNVRELENTVLRLVVNASENDISKEEFLHGSDPSVQGQDTPSFNSIRKRFEDEERRFILKSLVAHKFNLRATARALNVSHTTLYGKTKKYQIIPPE